MTADRVAFLRRMLDAEQAEAEKLTDVDDYSLEPWAIQWEETGEWNSYSYLRIAKARVLADVASKRSILDRWENYDREAPEYDVPDSVIEHLAAPYTGHPEYPK